ncbi:ATP-dependent RNA helicase [Aureococcus anophagefferens]|uniref:ATP-dependent RNA helicase n=1 Tax=Aureococcus anophagefferens TaxID=44056 RepID=A0ABR1FUM2_AURAN
MDAIVATSTTPDELPIAQARDDIVRLLVKHDFLVVVGDTGSGKTTQVPAYLLAADEARLAAEAAAPGDAAPLGTYDAFAPVAITQPRRVAATSVSQRVAEERGCDLGGSDVGYKVRFDSNVGAATGSRLTFMTDGVLVRECVGDGSLRKYRTVMLDEAHERSVDTDVLFGLVKRAVERRRGAPGDRLRCVVASATLDAEKFAKYFDGCPVLRVPGRTHPVDVYHSKQTQVMTRFGPASRSYVGAAVDVALQLHRSQPPGHVLVFLTGQDEIEEACANLRTEAAQIEDEAQRHGELAGPRLLALPLYGALPADVANRVFGDVDDAEIRKVVVATNIAETSLTVPGVKYVVDTGYVKMKGYDPSRAVASLVVVPISKVSAEQRAGRAGRTTSGQCYRLYSKQCFANMAPETIPEIRRSSMCSVALALKSLHVDDVLDFDFLDAPDETQLACALLELHALGALDAANKGRLTDVGFAMSRLALEPPLGRALLESVGFRKGSRRALPTTRESVLAIAAMLSAEDVWFVGGDRRDLRGGPSKRRDAADELRDEAFDKHAKFRHPRGDLISLLRAKKARDQLDDELRRVAPEAPSGGGRVDLAETCDALCAGLCLNAAERTLNDAYLLLPCAGTAYEAREAARAGKPAAPHVALVRLDATTTSAFARPPDTICFFELRVSRNSRGSFAKNVVVVDRATLDACRTRVDTTTPEALCGRPPKPVEAAPAKPAAPGRRPEKRKAPEEKAAPPKADASALAAAKARFLARKR